MVSSEITVVPAGSLTVTLTVAPGVPVPVNSSSVENTVLLDLVFTVGAIPLLISFDLAIESVDPSL